MDSRKVIYENAEKTPLISQQIYLYIRVTDIFHYAYIPPYMHKTLPTFGNEKEQ